MKSKILGILIALLFAAGYVTLNYPVLGTLYNQIREGKVMDSYASPYPSYGLHGRKNP